MAWYSLALPRFLSVEAAAVATSVLVYKNHKLVTEQDCRVFFFSPACELPDRIRDRVHLVQFPVSDSSQNQMPWTKA